MDLRSGEELQEDDLKSLLWAKAGLESFQRSWSGRVKGRTVFQPPPGTSLIRRNISLLERWRSYLGLTWQRPRKSATAMLVSLIVSREQGRKMLLKEVNAGGLGLLYRYERVKLSHDPMLSNCHHMNWSNRRHIQLCSHVRILPLAQYHSRFCAP